MTGRWTEKQTGTHQDHVIAHVLGATVLGYFAADDALHLALDIGFIWTIFADAEMGLLPGSLALRELNVGGEDRARLSGELQVLYDGDADAGMFTRITPAAAGCLIEEVRLLEQDDQHRLEIQGELSGFSVEISLTTGEMSIEELQISE